MFPHVSSLCLPGRPFFSMIFQGIHYIYGKCWLIHRKENEWLSRNFQEFNKVYQSSFQCYKKSYYTLLCEYYEIKHSKILRYFYLLLIKWEAWDVKKLLWKFQTIEFLFLNFHFFTVDELSWINGKSIVNSFEFFIWTFRT